MTETEGKQGSHHWVFAPNGLPARLALAVLGSVGILYANFSPVIVSGLAQSAYFTAETAAYVFAANMYGTAIGGFAVFLSCRFLVPGSLFFLFFIKGAALAAPVFCYFNSIRLSKLTRVQSCFPFGCFSLE